MNFLSCHATLNSICRCVFDLGKNTLRVYVVITYPLLRLWRGRRRRNNLVYSIRVAWQNLRYSASGNLKVI